jgi:uncharacterized membrane protein
LASFLLDDQSNRAWIGHAQSVRLQARHNMHKIGVLLTIGFLIFGLWDVRSIYENETFEHVFMPILGILVFCGGLKYALNRHI